MQHEIRLTDANGYTVATRTVHHRRIAKATYRMRTLATRHAAHEKDLCLQHASALTGLNAENARNEAARVRATDYRVRITPPVA
ncbi:hypothetical protein ABT224_20190 [Streptomyces sp. NPDC001584]|uniref:hypothetical protein n=1 Tax=Streptomyces sp. NPDC001584 TaxID=3154521 RepID=UPI003322D6B1